jgi:hypothetical protein
LENELLNEAMIQAGIVATSLDKDIDAIILKVIGSPASRILSDRSSNTKKGPIDEPIWRALKKLVNVSVGPQR